MTSPKVVDQKTGLEYVRPAALADDGDPPDIPGMSQYPTREEMNARFEAIGARMDARFAELQATLAKLPSKWELFGYTATVAALAVAVISMVVAILAWRQDQFIAVSDKPAAAASAPAPQPIIINVPPAAAPPEPAKP